MKNAVPTDLSSYQCPVTFCLNIIGGKWKPIIIYLVSNGQNRFGMLKRSIKGISKQMLTSQLRELESDGIFNRVVLQVVPPKVEYTLTQRGTSLLPVIQTMENWGNLEINRGYK